MIKSKNGRVDIKAKCDCDIMADFMCAMLGVSECVIVPTHGKDNLKSELYKIVDKVCDEFEKRGD